MCAVAAVLPATCAQSRLRATKFAFLDKCENATSLARKASSAWKQQNVDKSAYSVHPNSAPAIAVMESAFVHRTRRRFASTHQFEDVMWNAQLDLSALLPLTGVQYA
jgi:hypothetical protein